MSVRPPTGLTLAAVIPATDNASSIRCDAATVRYPGGVTAVDDVSLEVRPAEIHALIGPSGCGKTTLLRLFAGLQPATCGKISVEPIAQAHDGEIAFVFQQPSLLPWRTALENVTLPLELVGGHSRSQRRNVAEEMLEAVSLSSAADRFPDQLSGGMKMRVSIARALVTRPRVLLLDEPFAALDDMLRNQLGQLFLDLWQQNRFTAVMVTHNIAESIYLSHRISVMNHGRLECTLENPLPHPRQESIRRSAAFGDFYGEVSDSLRGNH